MMKRIGAFFWAIVIFTALAVQFASKPLWAYEYESKYRQATANMVITPEMQELINRKPTFRAVNLWVNMRIKGVDEGENDHWQSPTETLEKRTGDCEDYAILKEAILKALGYKTMILIGRTRDGSGHAVLGVVVDGEWWFLDNSRRDAITLDGLLLYFKPVYYFDKEGKIQFFNGK